MRRAPPPLSVTRPPPSSTTVELVLRTLAVAFMVIVTGSGPQSKVMIPPWATALTTAAEVQPAGVPLPMVRFGLLVSTARAAAGIAAPPEELPGFGRVFTGFLVGEGLTEGEGLVEAGGVEAGGGAASLAAGEAAGATAAVFSGSPPQPPRSAALITTVVSIASCRFRTGRL
jgi:hypothetical protein